MRLDQIYTQAGEAIGQGRREVAHLRLLIAVDRDNHLTPAEFAAMLDAQQEIDRGHR